MSEQQPTGDTTLVTGLIDQTLRAINDADAEAAVNRVARVRDEQSHLDEDGLIEQLIRQKALPSSSRRTVAPTSCWVSLSSTSSTIWPMASVGVVNRNSVGSESKTLAKLRHPTRSNRLRDYLEET